MNSVTPGQSRTADAITHEQSLYLNTEYVNTKDKTNKQVLRSTAQLNIKQDTFYGNKYNS